MRSIIVFALLALALGATVPRLYLDATARTPPAAQAGPQAPATPAGGYRSLTLRKDDRGHFQTEASLDGRRVSVLVDTGASVIALRASDAARLGVRPQARDYTARVTTANGTVMAAPTEIGRVDVGGIVVHHVAALVLPDEALSQNLLGMSFLSRVRFEHHGGRLMLEQ
ncbi:TIGR02281 family clan AA aspartic protease [Rhodoplanes sp. TEM]|uniref:TIGR02281 family clan AA aspartic protease n=1 Tax=Rhodoplanes tepidamans TaxID=200616 RepID=A0ABT5J8P3_RHOTP|nr:MULTISPECIES: TIGR02281 family clan AA aspartic protease [Rhodoplanes]MDC7786028.1 TIGR02281 family clan AA aspartic protease [Rhodoplanes tepidamans]MDC7983831.1 TIGR02281 family clan AA aspartic protease [Rhodoplanes sp. TEM]MDQ0354870.1 aspartyl protease family protein [Rhodoplanes tepidamans]